MCTCCGPLHRQQNLLRVCFRVDTQSHSASPWHKLLIQGYCSELEHDLRRHKTHTFFNISSPSTIDLYQLFHMDSLTFAHSIRVSLQFTVFHAWNEVKQSKNLFLGESSSSRHHQAACDVPRAIVHELVAARVSWTGRECNTVNTKTKASQLH